VRSSETRTHALVVVARGARSYLAILPARMLDIPVQPEDTQVATAKKKTKKTKKPSGNQPHLDLQTELKRICGVDLTSIDGIDVMTARHTSVHQVGHRPIQGAAKRKGQNGVVGREHRDGGPEYAGVETGEQPRNFPPVWRHEVSVPQILPDRKRRSSLLLEIPG
jgi:hypothetical protein